jgi:hypothetical protein
MENNNSTRAPVTQSPDLRQMNVSYNFPQTTKIINVLKYDFIFKCELQFLMIFLINTFSILKIVSYINTFHIEFFE